MSLFLIAALALGAFGSGFVNGLAGFGTAVVSLSIWLHVFEPGTAAALAVTCSVIGSVQAFIRRGTELFTADAVPMMIAGFLGIPIGVSLLAYLDPAYVRFAVGVLLVVYVLFSLARPNRVLTINNRKPVDMGIGLFAGFLGGFAGLSGIIPSFWGNLCGWGKLEQRRFYQTFNATILSATLVVYFFSGAFSGDVGWFALVCVPFAVGGTALGLRLFDWVNEKQFRLAIHLLLLFSGLTLVLPVS